MFNKWYWLAWAWFYKTRTWNTLLLVEAISLKISALIEIKKEGISWRHDTLALKEMSKFLLLIWHFYLIYSYIFDIFAKMPILFLWEVGGGGTLLYQGQHLLSPSLYSLCNQNKYQSSHSILDSLYCIQYLNYSIEAKFITDREEREEREDHWL